jgi:O-antigen ligase
LALGILIVGMVGALLLSTANGSFSLQAALALVLGATAAVALLLAVQGMSEHRLPGPIWAMLVCITLSGVPGMTLNPNEAFDKNLPFLLLLVVRNAVCFFAIPLSLAAQRSRLEDSLCKWALAAAAIVAVTTLWVTDRAALSLQSTTRLSGTATGWLNGNTTAACCAYGLLVCAMAKFIPRQIRLFLALPMLLCLLLTQSRTAMAALAISLGTLFVISYRRRTAVAVAIVSMALVLTVFFWQNVASLSAIPVLNSIVNRLQGPTGYGDDMRAAVIQNGLDTWSQAPIFGQGFNAQDTRFENGYLSLACETGAIGLLLYLGFVALVGLQIRRLLATPDNSRASMVGRYLLCTTVFVLVHGLGERSHAFQLGSFVSNIWAMLTSLGYVVPLSGHTSARRPTCSPYRPSGETTYARAPLRVRSMRGIDKLRESGQNG